MALRKKILRIDFSFSDGSIITVKESLMIRAKIKKAALSMQNSAAIDIGGMDTKLRASLLSRFNLFQNRRIQQGEIDSNPVYVTVTAGYSLKGVETSAVVYRGEVVTVDISSPPPNIVISLTCMSRQIDRTRFVVVPPPSQMTLEGYARWVAKQMNITDVTVDTSDNNRTIENPARGAITVSALLIDLQTLRTPSITAFVDDDRLFVKDTNRIIDKGDIAVLTEFIGMPSWTEWGVNFCVLFDPNIRLAGGVEIRSKMNETITNQFVVTSLEYDLSSRDVPFYVRGNASPPA